MESKESRVGLKGVLAAVLTPMDEDLNADPQAFAAHCHRLLAAGCHGLSVFGTTGEANSLSVDERLAALEALVDGGVSPEKLLPGTGSCALTDTVRLSHAALEAGTAGDLVLPLISRLIDAYPGVVVGTKDSSGDRERIMTLCREFPDFSVLAGTETLLLETLRGGGEGCISATVNVTSRLARQVYDAHASGKDDEAEALQERLTQLRASIEAHPVIPALKVLMADLTDNREWRNLRPPLSGLDEEQTKHLLSEVPLAELL